MIRLVLGAVLLSSLFRLVFLQEAESEAQIEERLGKITESLGTLLTLYLSSVITGKANWKCKF